MVFHNITIEDSYIKIVNVSTPRYVNSCQHSISGTLTTLSVGGKDYPVANIKIDGVEYVDGAVAATDLIALAVTACAAMIPADESLHELSLAERVIGTYHDGKPLYQISGVVDLATNPTNTSEVLDITASDINFVNSKKAVWLHTADTEIIQSDDADILIDKNVADNDRLTIDFRAAMKSALTWAHYTLEYTKVSDL